MSTDGLESLDHSAQVIRHWVNELDESLGWENKHSSLRLLRAVLHALRDCLPVVESAHLASQLPILVRGMYFEQWRPGQQEGRRWTRRHFLEHVEASLRGDGIANIDDAVKAVLALLAAKISAGEIRHVIGCLPTEVRDLWVENAAFAD